MLTVICLLIFHVSNPMNVFAETIEGSVETVDEGDNETEPIVETEIIEETEDNDNEDIGETEENPSEEENPRGESSEDDGEDTPTDPGDIPETPIIYTLGEDITASFADLTEYNGRYYGSKKNSIELKAVDSRDVSSNEEVNYSAINTIYYCFGEELHSTEGNEALIALPENYEGEFLYWAADSFGNETACRKINLVSDSSAPVIDISQNDLEDGSRKYSVNITEGKKTDAGVCEYEVDLGSEKLELSNISMGEMTNIFAEKCGFKSISFDFAVSLDCEEEINVKAVDLLGNEQTVSYKIEQGTIEDEPEPEEELPIEYQLGETVSVDAKDGIILEEVYVGSEALKIEVSAQPIEEDTEGTATETDDSEAASVIIEKTEIVGFYSECNGETTYHEGRYFDYEITSSFSGDISFWGVDEHGNETEHKTVAVWLDMDAPVIDVQQETRVDGSVVLHVTVKEGGENGYGILSNSNYVDGECVDLMNYEVIEENGNFVSPDGTMECSYDILLEKTGLNYVEIVVSDWWNNEAIYEEEVEVSVIPMNVVFPTELDVHVFVETGKVSVDPVVITNNSPYDIIFTLKSEEVVVSRLPEQKEEDKDCILYMNIEYREERSQIGILSSGKREDGYSICLPGYESTSDEKNRQLIIYLEGIISDRLGMGWNGEDLKVILNYSYNPAYKDEQ